MAALLLEIISRLKNNEKRVTWSGLRHENNANRNCQDDVDEQERNCPHCIGRAVGLAHAGSDAVNCFLAQSFEKRE